MMEQSMDALEDKDAFAWTIHYSGDLQNQTAKDLRENLGSNGQPVFFLNDDNVGALSSNYPSKVVELEESVDLLSSLGSSVEVNVDATFGNTLNVDVSLEFVQGVDGEYYLGVYLVEDNVIANQANQGPNTSHPNVVRKALTSTTFGSQIVINPETGFTFSDSFSEELTLGPDDALEDFSIVAIVWNLNVNDQYRMFNLGVDQVSEATSSISDDALRAKFKVHSANNGVQISTTQNDVYTVNIYDLSGKQIFTATENGSQHIPLAQNGNTMYLIEIQQYGKRFSEKVFLK